MTDRPTRPSDRPGAAADQPSVRWPWLLSNRGLAVVASCLALVGVCLLLAMLLIAARTPEPERAKLQIETLKYGLGFFAAGGAVAAILLSTRRQLLSEHTHGLAVKTQQLSELNHALALKAQAHVEDDAAERRVTDLYAKAVEQLGSSDAAVRLGGLYALERVAQNHPSQRQTVINLLCAYLRMPYEPPARPGRRDTTDAREPLAQLPLPVRAVPSRGRDPLEELQVRLTAQRIIATHARSPDGPDGVPAERSAAEPAHQFWAGLELDLAGATLIDWTLAQADIASATFRGTVFVGDAHFAGTEFREADFSGARFQGEAQFPAVTFRVRVRFDGLTVEDAASFDGAVFAAGVSFQDATFLRNAEFLRAGFTGEAWFGATRFCGEASFDLAEFHDEAWFGDAEFRSEAWIDNTTFGSDTSFERATFEGLPRLDQASVLMEVNYRSVWPPGWTVLPGFRPTRLIYRAGSGPGID
ncbi:pentapeptide repeat-containing protein [Jidongwangia harbinensis]|uniref:pentapeptide repeat-containing protein n=1 Tax=Jidongwangia harbinensis TaxID=2878561 RepID=UPI001CD9858F|nr:pentapeptide repeat-containing protein [Jidongwangia harbinensis]MCA2216562.1 pentapeptide repeat-containing protein [Jidongwangia harbinensis]